MQLSRLCSFVLLVIVSASSALAEEGISEKAIRIGMSNALTGPSAGLGLEMKQGADAYFKKINSKGGVHGRKIDLVALDDQYEPEFTAKNTIKLIDEEKVFALTGYVGTPTGKAAIPIIGHKNVPLVGMFTGAEAFRNPVVKNVFHVRASYFAETERMVERLVTDLKLKEIGIFIQDDAFGAAGEAGVNRALVRRDLKLHGKGIFKRNTTDVDTGLFELKKANPKAVILVGAYAGCAEFMKKAVAQGWKPVFINISFVGTHNLIEAAGAAAENSYITQVVPLNRNVSVEKDYLADLKAMGGKTPSYGSFEGYLSAMVLVEGLKRAGPAPTREGLRQVLEKMQAFDLGGLSVSYSSSNHEGLKDVYLTKVVKGRAVPVSKLK